MILNDSIHYLKENLHCDNIPVMQIAAQVGTPVYIYSLKRIIANYQRIHRAFANLDAHIHYSAKANGNLAVLHALANAGSGIDTVSGGEIHRALAAGVTPEKIVFAGVGKTHHEIRYAVEKGVGWFNIENVDECRYINDAAAAVDRKKVQVALRLNPEVTANTHPYIATGHGGAKFGLTADTIKDILSRQMDYPHLDFAGIHLHIGSQLGDTDATRQALQITLNLVKPYPLIRTLNIGGGLPVAYEPGQTVSDIESFAEMITPMLQGYTLLLEPGRYIVADAGMLIARILYVKRQAGQTFYITDASIAELIRPALYQAHHEIMPVYSGKPSDQTVQITGPVCETADMLGKDRQLPEMQPGDLLAIMTSGAYGMVMASNYNARPLPAEVTVAEDGESWQVARRRQTWEDLLKQEKPI